MQLSNRQLVFLQHITDSGFLSGQCIYDNLYPDGIFFFCKNIKEAGNKNRKVLPYWNLQFVETQLRQVLQNGEYTSTAKNWLNSIRYQYIYYQKIKLNDTGK